MIDSVSMGIMANYVQPSSSTMASHMISKKDSDSDLSLSIDEMGIDENIFSSIDTNLDGLASQSELATAIDTAMSQFDGEMPSKEEFQSILASFGFEAPSHIKSSSSSSLSSSQLETISSVLEGYDSDNLTQSDAMEIVAAFKEAGIKPSAELESAMEEAGFSAQEVGTLAGVAPQAGAGPQGGGQGGGGGAMTSSEEEEEYDIMDTNQDGVVSLQEIQEYYGGSDSNESTTLSNNEQNTLDNLQLLMEILKSNSNDGSIDSKDFNGILKTINNQNNNSQINTYFQNSSLSNITSYA